MQIYILWVLTHGVWPRNWTNIKDVVVRISLPKWKLDIFVTDELIISDTKEAFQELFMNYFWELLKFNSHYQICHWSGQISRRCKIYSFQPSTSTHLLRQQTVLISRNEIYFLDSHTAYAYYCYCLKKSKQWLNPITITIALAITHRFVYSSNEVRT